VSVSQAPAPTLAPPALAARGENRLLRPAVAWGLGVAAVVFGVVAVSASRLLQVDSFVTLYSGREIALHGLPHTDTLTVAAHGRPWIDQQWLAHWLFYELWSLGGYPLLGACSSLLIASAFGLLAALLISRGSTPVRALIWTGAAFVVCQLNMQVRAQSFAYPLFVALLWLLLSDDRRARFNPRILLGIPLLVMWANLHGSVLLGAGLLAGHCGWRVAGSARRRDLGSAARYAATGLASLPAALATPYGSDILSYYPSVLNNPAVARIQEWQPASFDGPSRQFAALLLITIGVVGFGWGRGRRPALLPGALTALTALAGMHALRYQAWFAFPAAVMVTDTLAATAPAAAGASLLRPRLARLLPRILAVAAAAAALLAAGKMWSTGDGRYEALLPQRAMLAVTAWGDRHPDARILADDFTASPLLWKSPELAGRVGFDSRIELFPSTTFLAYTRFVSLQGSDWPAAARGYDAVLVSCGLHPDLCSAFAHRAGWRVLEHDRDGLAAVRVAGRA
jgi:hypothetical protein